MLPLQTYSKQHCQDVDKDRGLGQHWERQFCLMAAKQGKSFTPLQIDRSNAIVAHQWQGNKWNRFTLPDVAIWTAPGEHHEIKHKNPFNDRQHGPSFGLEVYRFEALLWFAKETAQHVMYTIHNHDLSGGRDSEQNHIDHWLTANVAKLNGKWHTKRTSPSYVGGQQKVVEVYYWSVDLWIPLSVFWKLI